MNLNLPKWPKDLGAKGPRGQGAKAPRGRGADRGAEGPTGGQMREPIEELIGGRASRDFICIGININTNIYIYIYIYVYIY